MNYYQILGLTRHASTDEIRKAYRSLARKYHPDLNPSKESEENFRMITSAYDVLSDPLKRTQYNHTLDIQQSRYKNNRTAFRSYREQAHNLRKKATRNHTQSQEKENHSSNGKNSTRSYFRIRRGQLSLHGLWKKLLAWSEQLTSSIVPTNQNEQVCAVSVLEVMVTLEEAIYGVKKKVEIPAPHARSIVVNVPPGVRNGSVVRLRSKTDPIEDMIVIIRIAPHQFLSIHPRGLVAEIPITVHEAVHGARIKVPTLDSPLYIAIPPGSQSGKEIRLRGRGITNRDETRGDLYVRLMIKVPTDKAKTKELERITRNVEELYQGSVRAKYGTALVNRKK